MTTPIEELIQKQQELSAPPAPEPTWLDILVQKQRELMENRWEPLEIVLGDELVPLELGRLDGDTWEGLAAEHQPLLQDDEPLGYNRRTLPRDYPASRIKLQGKPTTQETWQTVWDLLDPEDRTNVGAVIWGINIGESLETLERLKQEAE